MRKLLVIDDDAASCRLVAAIFKREGVEVTSANDGTTGLARLEAVRPDVVLLDLQMPGMDGIEVLRRIRTADSRIPVVMLTVERDVKPAVRAMQLGAFDYQTKPVNPEEIVVTVKRAFETCELKHEVAELREQVGQGGGLAAQMGRSGAIERLVEQVKTVAATTFTVLLVGETGTGKELVAQAIHRQSERRSLPFVALDCGAIPGPLMESELFGHEKGAFTGADRRKRGQFDLAAGGTVFLDELGNLPMALQAKLLRVLEARQIQPVGGARATLIDVRFIAATNDDLQKLVSEGRFRADLYFRLAQYTVALPPLRDRREDVAYLANRFLEEVCIELRRPVQAIAPDAMAALEGYAWPGNVRELRNVIRQAVLESKSSVLPKSAVRRFLGRARSKTPASNAVGKSSLKDIASAAAREAERQLICDTLRETNGNKSQAARTLQTDYKTLHVKMKALGIRARDFMPA
jgi:DNA-binding NtrC family response regulator